MTMWDIYEYEVQYTFGRTASMSFSVRILMIKALFIRWLVIEECFVLVQKVVLFLSASSDFSQYLASV